MYRVNGNYENVINNIKKINKAKIKYKSRYPVLTWQFIIFGHNEHEIPIARKYAEDLGMKFNLKLCSDDGFSPVKDKEFVRLHFDKKVSNRHEYARMYGEDYVQNICFQLWDEPQINWNGQLLGCCKNYWGDFGVNVFSHGLLPAINSEKMKIARNMLLGVIPSSAAIPCAQCPIYTARKHNNNWIIPNTLHLEVVKHVERLK
jgi:hypothetical protein